MTVSTPPNPDDIQPSAQSPALRHRQSPTSSSAAATTATDKPIPTPAATTKKSSFASRFRRNGKLQPFLLLRQDLHNLRHRWVSDWTLFDQLVLASSVYVFFTNILPGITFASDLYILTGQSWGTIEVVFSTGICGLIFALFSAQPLTILGVTGPFSVLAENIYKLCETSFHVEFLPLMAWSLIHSAWMHYLLAIFNAHDWTMQYVTHFSADIFSLLNSVIYFHKAAMELKRTHDDVSFAAFLYAVIGCIGTCLFAIFLSTARYWQPLFHRYVRLGLTEYAAAISIILFIGLPQIGELKDLDHRKLSVSTSFKPTSPERSTFFVKFWTLPIEWIFLSIIPGAIITVLFYFDHEISSIICTVKKYGTRKPGGYAWDIILLGTTTAMCGILGIPPANGLLPQAPLHSESLMHTRPELIPVVSTLDTTTPPEKDASQLNAATLAPTAQSITSTNTSTTTTGDGGAASPAMVLVPVTRVHEQRYSHFIQAALILLFVTPPFQRLLGLTPTSVLAGLFLFMGYQSLSVNPILERLGNLVTPTAELPALQRAGGGGVEAPTWLGVHMYTLTQVLLTALVFGVTLTVAAPAFPVIIIALVPVRLHVMNRVWSRATLRHVDGWACREGKPEDEAVAVEEFRAEGVEDEEKRG